MLFLHLAVLSLCALTDSPIAFSSPSPSPPPPRCSSISTKPTPLALSPPPAQLTPEPPPAAHSPPPIRPPPSPQPCTPPLVAPHLLPPSGPVPLNVGPPSRAPYLPIAPTSRRKRRRSSLLSFPIRFGPSWTRRGIGRECKLPKKRLRLQPLRRGFGIGYKDRGRVSGWVMWEGTNPCRVHQ